MAVRALQFAEANPSTGASYVAVAAKLHDAVTRADVLAIQQRDGIVNEHTAVGLRDPARRKIQRPHLRHLVRVARLAVKETPALAGNFVLPDPKGPNKALITAAKAMRATALSAEAAFVGLGLGETFLADLTKAVDAFDTAAALAQTSHLGHVWARADLEVMADECVQFTGVMDGLTRALFGDDPEMLAAWISASEVVGPFHFKSTDPVAPPEPEPVPVVVAVP